MGYSKTFFYSRSEGVKGTALQWFSSYLRGRRNRVTVSGAYSLEHIMDFGLPQGSVIGPMGFSMYTHPLGKIICQHSVFGESI